MQEELYHLFTALGNALFCSLWQMGIIWLMIAVYTYLRPAASDAANSLLRFAGLMAGFALFLITFFVSLKTAPAEQPILKWGISPEWSHSLLNYCAILYLLLLIFPLRNILKNSTRLRRLRKNGIGRVPGALKIFMLDAAGYLNIKRKVRLYTSSIISSPLTIGFLKPVILLPLALINQLTPQQLEAIILHELAHIRRNDYLINLVTQIVLTLLYFNPFARMLVKAQELDREKSADQWVLRFEYGRYMYASTLLQLARNPAPAGDFALHVTGKESQLSNRVAAIMDGGIARPVLPFKKMGILACVLLLSGGLFLVRNTQPPVSSTAVRQSRSMPIATADATDVAPVFAAASTTAADEKNYEVRPIPVLEKPDRKPANDAIYLKICEDPSGKMQAPAPPAPAPPADPAQPLVLFADHPVIVVPDLDSAAEDKVQQSIESFKKLITELSWKHVENSLAETVTEQQKKALKNQLTRVMDQMNWEQNANILRSFYKDINWEQADDQLKASLDALLYARSEQYRAALKQATAEQQHRAADSSYGYTLELRKRADSLHLALRKKDSIQNRIKVVDL
ncbi:M56 family metallopeptidase [Niabella sp. CC-SYL272]|uniref:M56 family metallopeptidase n=1 Tax=Niabella agricola TaxID=2891571 RepID=UPI001F45E590|nr:M56 family metallopeptidase [Niabella agricola]MCF3108531.1 M56 family metallopeptidase [Niabella agricola]